MQNPFIFSDRELPPLEENTLQIDDSDKHHMKMGSKVEYCFSSSVPTVEPLPLKLGSLSLLLGDSIKRKCKTQCSKRGHENRLSFPHSLAAS